MFVLWLVKLWVEILNVCVMLVVLVIGNFMLMVGDILFLYLIFVLVSVEL